MDYRNAQARAGKEPTALSRRSFSEALMLRTRSTLVPALVFLAPLASATTWVVDDDGGPGVDFTSIQAAISGSAAGDVLLVQPGTYGPFTLSTPLSILGQGPAVVVSGAITVSGLPVGTRAALVGLTASQNVFVLNCAGVVLGDLLQAGNTVTISGSADVRLRRASAPTLSVTSSRAEVVDSQFTAHSAPDCLCCASGAVDGGNAVLVSGGELHLARSGAQGGAGADIACADTGFCEPAGNGGRGLSLSNGARVLLSGNASHVLAGGAAGDAYSGCSIFPDGAPGAGAHVPATTELRTSGVTLVGAVAAGGVLDQVSPADPSMRVLETPTPGAILTFRVQAPPGSDVDVILGRQPILVEVPGLEEDVLATTNRVFDLGVVPENGTISLAFPTSAAWPKGFLLVFQAVVTLPDTSVRRSHSIPVVFR